MTTQESATLIRHSAWRRGIDLVRGAVGLALGALVLIGAAYLIPRSPVFALVLALAGIAILALTFGRIRPPGPAPRWSSDEPSGVRFDGARPGRVAVLGILSALALFVVLIVSNARWLQDQGTVDPSTLVAMAVLTLVSGLVVAVAFRKLRHRAPFVVTAEGLDLQGRPPGGLTWEQVRDIRHEEVPISLQGALRYADMVAVAVHPDRLDPPGAFEVYRQHLGDLGPDPERVLAVLRRLHAEPQLRDRLKGPEGVALFNG